MEKIRPWSDNEHIIAHDMRERGRSYKHIAEMLGRSESTVKQHLTMVQSKKNAVSKPRRCLVCGEMRDSTGPGDRLHPNCSVPFGGVQHSLTGVQVR